MLVNGEAKECKTSRGRSSKSSLGGGEKLEWLKFDFS